MGITELREEILRRLNEREFEHYCSDFKVLNPSLTFDYEAHISQSLNYEDKIHKTLKRLEKENKLQEFAAFLKKKRPDGNFEYSDFASTPPPNLIQEYRDRVQQDNKNLSFFNQQMAMAEGFIPLYALQKIREERKTTADKSQNQTGRAGDKNSETSQEKNSSTPNEGQAPPPPPPPPPPPVPVEAQIVALEHEKLLIFGGAGMGKSTLMRYLAYQESVKPDGFIPILVMLKEYRGQGLKKFCLDHAAPENKRLRELLEAKGEDKKIWWLLDGLDESHNKHEVLRRAKDLPGKVTITSRPDDSLTFDQQFTLRKLSLTDIQQFLLKYFSAVLPEDESQKRVAQTIQNAQNNSAFGRLLESPLLLTIWADIHHNTHSQNLPLPTSEVELYKSYFDRVIRKEVERYNSLPQHKKQLLNPDLLPQTFYALGFILHYEGNPAGKEVEKSLSKYLTDIPLAPPQVFEFWQGTGLLLSGWRGEPPQLYFMFQHQSFQEYAVACFLHEAWQKDPAGTWQLLAPQHKKYPYATRLHHPTWQEPLRLLAQKMSSQELEQFINHLWQTPSPDEKYLHRDLLLVPKLVNGVDSLAHKSFALLVNFLNGLVNYGKSEILFQFLISPYPGILFLIAKILYKDLHLQVQVELLSIIKFVVVGLIFRIAFILVFVVNLYATFLLFSPEQFIITQLVLGILLFFVILLSFITHPIRFKYWLKDTDFWLNLKGKFLQYSQDRKELYSFNFSLCTEIINYLGRLDVKASANYISLYKDIFPCDAKIYAEIFLKTGRKEEIINLYERGKITTSSLQLVAKQIDSKLATQTIIDLCLDDRNDWVLIPEGSSSWGDITSPFNLRMSDISPLTNLLMNYDNLGREVTGGINHILRLIVQTLGDIGNPEAIPSLFYVLKHPYTSVNEPAAESLIKIGKRFVLNLQNEPLQENQNISVKHRFIQLLKDLDNTILRELEEVIKPAIDEKIEYRIAYVIACWGDLQALPLLMKLYIERNRSNQEWNLEKIVKAISNMGEGVVDELKRILETSKNYREQIIIYHCLAKIGNKKAIEVLIDNIEKDYIPLESLVESNYPDALNAVLAQLNKGNFYASEDLITKIGQLKDPHYLNFLHKTLQKNHKAYLEELFNVINKKEGHTFSEAKIYIATLNALSYFGTVETVNLLTDLLEINLLIYTTFIIKHHTYTINPTEQHERVMAEIIATLGKLGDFNSVELISDVLAKNLSFQLNQTTVNALGQIQNPKAIKLLATLFEHNITKINTHRGEDSIHPFLEAQKLLENIVCALGKINTPEAISTLIEFANKITTFPLEVRVFPDVKSALFVALLQSPDFYSDKNFSTLARKLHLNDKYKKIGEEILSQILLADETVIMQISIDSYVKRIVHREGEKCIDIFLNELKTCEPKERGLWIGYLQQFGKRENGDVINALKPFLYEADLTKETIEALAKVGDVTVFDDLISLLKGRKYKQYHNELKKALGEITPAVTDTLELEKVRKVLWQTRFEGDPEVNWVAYSQVVGRLTELQVDELTQKEPKFYLFLPANS